MLRFSKLKKYEISEIQFCFKHINFQKIYYIKDDLNEKEIAELKYYQNLKKLFEDIINDFKKIGL